MYQSSYLHIELRMRVHVVNKLLVVGVLRLHLLPIVIPEVVTQRDKKDVGSVELCFLLVLVQQHLGPSRYVARGDGLWVNPPRTGHTQRQGR